MSLGDLKVPAEQWDGDGRELDMQVIAVTAGAEPGWVTVQGWRYLSEEPDPQMVRVQVRVEALPQWMRPVGWTGAPGAPRRRL